MKYGICYGRAELATRELNRPCSASKATGAYSISTRSATRLLLLNLSSMEQRRSDITFGNLGSGFQIGINSGPIHLPPGTSAKAKPDYANAISTSERPETPPSPSSTVPFLRDPDYVDRQDLLEQVRAKCSIPASRTALVGLGGVG
jgi:hypothetical protein